jgi:hypothetical protein
VKKNGSLPGVLGELVTVEGNGQGILVVSMMTSENPKSKKLETASGKRQLKYLTKKYLAKQGLKNFLGVYAPSKDAYKIKFLAAIDKDDDEGAE